MNKENIKYWVIDVDGTMTDGSIYYDENGNELKKFNSRDAAGFFVASALGMQIFVITGRECKATKRRMEDLHVERLYQNIKDKKTFLEKIMIENQIKKDEIGYIGDDLNDLANMKIVGFCACPCDASKEVLSEADYISEFVGGTGVITDVIRYAVGEKNWKKGISIVYGV